MKKPKYIAYVQKLDNSLILLASGFRILDVETRAREYILDRPQAWEEFDKLVIAEVLMPVPVDLVLLGA